MSERPPRNTPENPILVEPGRVFCPGHGEHLRAQWPKGYAIAAMELMQAALASEKLIRAVDPTWDGKEGTAEFDVERLNAITERRPFCYFVDEDVILRALTAAGILRVQRCDLCGIPRNAGRYSVAYPTGVETKIVCLKCAMKNGASMHAAYPDGGVWTAQELQ